MDLRREAPRAKVGSIHVRREAPRAKVGSMDLRREVPRAKVGSIHVRREAPRAKVGSMDLRREGPPVRRAAGPSVPWPRRGREALSSSPRSLPRAATAPPLPALASRVRFSRARPLYLRTIAAAVTPTECAHVECRREIGALDLHADRRNTRCESQRIHATFEHRCRNTCSFLPLPR